MLASDILMPPTDALSAVAGRPSAGVQSAGDLSANGLGASDRTNAKADSFADLLNLESGARDDEATAEPPPPLSAGLSQSPPPPAAPASAAVTPAAGHAAADPAATGQPTASPAPSAQANAPALFAISAPGAAEAVAAPAADGAAPAAPPPASTQLAAPVQAPVQAAAQAAASPLMQAATTTGAERMAQPVRLTTPEGEPLRQGRDQGREGQRATTASTTPATFQNLAAAPQPTQGGHTALASNGQAAQPSAAETLQLAARAAPPAPEAPAADVTADPATADLEAAETARVQTLQTATAMREGPASGLSRATVETTALMAAQIVRRLEGLSTRFRMALTPEGLGRVDVNVEIDGEGRLAARLAFDNPVAATELRGRADELRRQLEDAGFHLGDDALEFAEREGGRDPADPFDQRRKQAFAGGNRLADEADLAAPAPRWAALTLTPEGLDMRV